MRNFSDKIPKFQNLWGLKASWNGQIWPPHLCITCFRTFLDVWSKNNWMDTVFEPIIEKCEASTNNLWRQNNRINYFLFSIPILLLALLNGVRAAAGWRLNFWRHPPSSTTLLQPYSFPLLARPQHPSRPSLDTTEVLGKIFLIFLEREQLVCAVSMHQG